MKPVTMTLRSSRVTVDAGRALAVWTEGGRGDWRLVVLLDGGETQWWRATREEAELAVNAIAAAMGAP